MDCSVKNAAEVLREIWHREYNVATCTYRRGNITIDAGAVERGLTSCPHCGATIGMGVLRIMHSDGRSVVFRVGFFHDVEAGHSLAGVDTDTLVSIVADA